MSTSTPSGRPEPVTDAAKLAGAVAAGILAVGGLLRVVGVVLPVDVEDVAQQASNVVLSAAVVWSLVGPWLLARLRARDLVTPLADPIDERGNALIADRPGQHRAPA